MSTRCQVRTPTLRRTACVESCQPSMIVCSGRCGLQTWCRSAAAMAEGTPGSQRQHEPAHLGQGLDVPIPCLLVPPEGSPSGVFESDGMNLLGISLAVGTQG